jgi:hypothetical protein
VKNLLVGKLETACFQDTHATVIVAVCRGITVMMFLLTVDKCRIGPSE